MTCKLPALIMEDMQSTSETCRDIDRSSNSTLGSPPVIARRAASGSPEDSGNRRQKPVWSYAPVLGFLLPVHRLA